MKIFVTGATGYLGHAIAAELLGAGHEVVGLTSSDAKVAQLERAGVVPAVGDVGDPGSYRKAAAGADASIHCAVEYSEAAVEKDGAAIETLLSAAGEGRTPRPVVYTSGVWVLGATGDLPADETSGTDIPAAAVAWRPSHEQRVLDGGRGVVPAVIRPGVVYGGKRGLMGRFFATAEEDGAAVYYGEGRGRMALVYLGDAARAYRLVVEQGAAGIFHAVDGTPLPMIDVARLASEAAGAGGAVRSVPIETLRAELGPAADAFVLDQVVTARRSGKELGWAPEQTSYRDGVAVAYREWRGGEGGAS